MHSDWEDSWNLFEQTGQISAYLNYCKQRTAKPVLTHTAISDTKKEPRPPEKGITGSVLPGKRLGS